MLWTRCYILTVVPPTKNASRSVTVVIVMDDPCDIEEKFKEIKFGNKLVQKPKQK